MRSINLYEMATGKRTWNIQSHQPPDGEGAGVCFDATGTVLAVNLSRDSGATFFDVISQEVLERVESRSPSSPPQGEAMARGRF